MKSSCSSYTDLLESRGAAATCFGLALEAPTVVELLLESSTGFRGRVGTSLAMRTGSVQVSRSVAVVMSGEGFCKGASTAVLSSVEGGESGLTGFSREGRV